METSGITVGFTVNESESKGMWCGVHVLCVCVCVHVCLSEWHSCAAFVFLTC